MANIKSYIENIEVASDGEQVRDSIIAALEAVNDQGGNASTLEGFDASHFATKAEVGEIGEVLDKINGEVI